MKRTMGILLLVLVLAGLFIGGGFLYRRLSAEPRSDLEETELSERHQMERDKTPEPSLLPETSAQEEAQEPDSEAVPEPVPETPEEPASVPLSEDLTADFHVLDEDGNTVNLSDSFGRPIVVNFFATWCPPCREELPYFDSACERYGDRIRFMVVDLTDGTSDTVESATAFIRDENGYSLPLFFDVDFSGVEAYQINAIPVTLFIRADGSLLHMQIGMLDENTLEDYLLQLLA